MRKYGVASVGCRWFVRDVARSGVDGWWCWSCADRTEETTIMRRRRFQTDRWGVTQCPVKLHASVSVITDLDSAEQRWSCTGLIWMRESGGRPAQLVVGREAWLKWELASEGMMVVVRLFLWFSFVF